MIGKTISHYKILDKIGEGGRGVVYKAEDIDLKRVVALKFISPHLTDNVEDLERLYQEARSASQLNHPNIATIYEIGHSGKHNFIAMECISGETLKGKIQKEALTLNKIITIAIETLNGIKAAHNSKIIHRDIKSENIMVNDSGVVKVMDFGLARDLDKKDITRVSSTIGTIAYMSPEQIEGSKVDLRSDLYSFGIVLYEMVTGLVPFIGEHEAATLYSIVNELPSDIATINPDTDTGLIAIIEKTIEKSPNDRYQNASELLDDLIELKSGTLNNRLKRPFWLSFVPKKIKQNRIVGGIIISLIIGLATILLYFNGVKGSSTIYNSLAVLNFDNIQEPEDPNRLGQILQELIIADLSEIPNLKVFSSQRLFDIQRQFGSENRNSIDPSMATEIAQEAGAKIMLKGNIIQTGNNLILTSQLINSNDGSIIKSHQVEGDDIYAMVDELTTQIQSDMQLPVSVDDQIDIAVADKTTSSMTAFQHYFMGTDYFNESHFDEAIVELKNAIEIDSTFSSAYYKLAMAQWWSQSEMNSETIKNAQESLTKVINGSWYTTTKEKLLARGALELTKHNYSEAEVIYQQLIDFISDEKEAWYGLGEAYFHGSQDFEKASYAFERAVELDPEFTIAYRHIFDIYNLRNQYDSGIIRATQMIDRNPDNVWGHIFLGQMFVGKEDYIQAKNTFQTALQIDHDLDIIYHYISYIFIELNQFNEGITFANDLIDSEGPAKQFNNLLAKMYIGKNEIIKAIDIYQNIIDNEPSSFQNMLSLAYAYQLNGQYDQAMAQCFNAERLFPELWKNKGVMLLSSIYLEQGRYKDVINLLEEGLSQLEESDLNMQTELHNSLAYLSFLLGDYSKASNKLNQVLSSSVSFKNQLVAYLIKGYLFVVENNINGLTEISQVVQDSVIQNKDETFHNIYNSALQFNNHFARGNYQSAIDEFNSMDDKGDLKYRYNYYAGLAYIELDNYPKVFELLNEMRKPVLPPNVHSFLYPRSFYLEGLVHEAMGNSEQAKISYQTILRIWKDGDIEAPDYQDALQRFNNL